MKNLSKEYVIQQVEGHKDRIRDATDRLSEVLYKARKAISKDFKLDDESALAIKKILHEIVSELSIIGGFCDNWTKKYIDTTVNIIGHRTATGISYPVALLLEWWAMRINGIIVDYTKTPFRLSELKTLFSVLKEALDKK
jgi:hypothetical protein